MTILDTRAALSARSTIPADVLAEIKAASLHGDVVSVTAQAYVFSGNVLKANTITFASGGYLLLDKLVGPWIAVVAKTIKFAAPEERAYVVQPTSTVFPVAGSPHPSLGQAGQGNHGGSTKAGGAGGPGAPGTIGNLGLSGPPVPTLYLVAESILTQPGNVPPDFIDLYLDCRGIDGAAGGPGQNGQVGGVGGSGGPADWNGVYCEGGAGDGGPGGSAGAGGTGGPGGNGSNGGAVFYAGSAAAINLLEFSKVNNLQGRRGAGGAAGNNGSPGAGGPRGERRGDCDGGVQGPIGSNSAASPQIGPDGQDGERGKIYTAVVDVNFLF